MQCPLSSALRVDVALCHPQSPQRDVCLLGAAWKAHTCICLRFSLRLLTLTQLADSACAHAASGFSGALRACVTPPAAKLWLCLRSCCIPAAEPSSVACAGGEAELPGCAHSICIRAGGGHHCAAGAGCGGCAESGGGCCASLSSSPPGALNSLPAMSLVPPDSHTWAALSLQVLLGRGAVFPQG